MTKIARAFVFVSLLSGISASAAIAPSEVHQAELKKTQSYIREGIVVGGDRAIDDVTVKDIRRATQSDFERIVMDLDAARSDQPTAVSRSPFYQVSLEPEQKRVTVTVFGNTRLGFKPKGILDAFRKSPNVAKVELFPRLDADHWSFALILKANLPVEVFELSDPVRIILDLKSKRGETKTAAVAKPKPKAKPAIHAEPAAPSYPSEEPAENGMDSVPADNTASQ